MVEIFRKTLAKEPVKPSAPVDDPELLHKAEDALFEAHRLNIELKPAAAVLMFKRALFLDPSNATAAAELGATLVDSGRVTEGLAAFTNHLESHPDAHEVRLAYAGSLLRTGALEAAVVECRRCIEQKADWEEPYPPLIRALHRLDRRSAALEALTIFKTLAKDHRIVAMLETMLEKAR